jgi:hypothetical protein
LHIYCHAFAVGEIRFLVKQVVARQVALRLLVRSALVGSYESRLKEALEGCLITLALSRGRELAAGGAGEGGGPPRLAERARLGIPILELKRLLEGADVRRQLEHLSRARFRIYNKGGALQTVADRKLLESFAKAAFKRLAALPLEALAAEAARLEPGGGGAMEVASPARALSMRGGPPLAQAQAQAPSPAPAQARSPAPLSPAAAAAAAPRAPTRASRALSAHTFTAPAASAPSAPARPTTSSSPATITLPPVTTVTTPTALMATAPPPNPPRLKVRTSDASSATATSPSNSPSSSAAPRPSFARGSARPANRCRPRPSERCDRA